MAGMSWDRWLRLSGIGFVVAFVVAFIVYGDPPKVNASAQDIVSFFDGDRGRVLTAMSIFGIAFMLFLFFVGAVANTLREAGEGGLAATSVAMGSTFVAVQAVTGALSGGLALNIAAVGDEFTVRTINTLATAGDVISAFPLAGFIFVASIGLSRARVIAGAWYMWFGLLVSVLVLLHGTNWAATGFWSGTGGYVWIAVLPALLWTLATSWLLYAAAGSRAPEREAVPTT
jgi:hypothetical protein